MIVVTSGVGRAGSLTIGSTTDPPSKISIDLDEKFAPAPPSTVFQTTTIQFADYATGPVELYPVNASPAERVQKACKLLVAGSHLTIPTAPTSPTCDKLLEDFGWKPITLAISKPGSTAYSIVELKPVLEFQGGDAAIDIPIDAKGNPAWDKAATPKYVRVKNASCYLMLDQPRPVTCNQATAKITIDDDARSVVLARWAKKDTVWLVANVLDAETSTGKWRKLELRPKPPKAPEPPAEEDFGDLEQRCKESINFPAKRDTYYVCVDLKRKRQGILTYQCGKDAESCDFVGDVVMVRRNFVVRVWTDDDVTPKVTLGGTAGSASLVRDGTKGIGGGAGEAEKKVQVWNFGPRKPGTATLVVTANKVKDDGTSSELGKLELPYTVEAYYRMAIRLGLGFSWMPWARKVDIQATADGQRFAAVIEGDDEGLTNTELVTGFTYLCSDVREDSLDVAFGLGVRLGLLGIGSNFTSFTSLTAGPELAIGPDFSVGLYGGIARHEVPNGGYEPGTLIPAAITKIPSHMTVTPTIGLVLNFTPGFLKTVGVVK